MGIQEDIFEAFFAKLKEDAEFPNEVVGELKKLWERNEIASEEKILSVFKGKGEDADNGKNG